MKTTVITLLIIFSSSLLMARAQDTYDPPDMNDLALEEEPYIDDIPFDTRTISLTHDPEKLVTSLPEEKYVDDIPFDTRRLALKAMFRECISQWKEEDYVNDIPFNTKYLACCQQMMTKVMPEYIDEKAARDICFNTEEIACKYLFNRMVEDFRMEESIAEEYAVEGITWSYNKRDDILTCKSGACIRVPGFRSLNSLDFRTDMERHMEQFSEKVRELDHLTIDEPF